MMGNDQRLAEANKYRQEIELRPWNDSGLQLNEKNGQDNSQKKSTKLDKTTMSPVPPREVLYLPWMDRM